MHQSFSFCWVSDWFDFDFHFQESCFDILSERSSLSNRKKFFFLLVVHSRESFSFFFGFTCVAVSLRGLKTVSDSLSLFALRVNKKKKKKQSHQIIYTE